MTVAVGEVSDLVDHQQVLAGVEAQLALEQGVAVDGGELAEHAGCGGEAHGVPLDDGAVGVDDCLKVRIFDEVVT